MNFHAVKFGVFSLVALLIIEGATSRIIDVSEQEPFQRSQLMYSNSVQDDSPSQADLFKYLLRNEILSRSNNIFDREERQKKGHYWKPCAFNAVTCFGKK